MFIAAYRWRVKPGKETQFRAAWRRGTELITAKYGSCGSQLHRTIEGDFVGVAQWPDEATWRAAFAAKMAYEDDAARTAFLDAIEKSDGEPFLLMELTDDLLMVPQQTQRRASRKGLTRRRGDTEA